MKTYFKRLTTLLFAVLVTSLFSSLIAQDKSKIIIDVDMGQLNDDAVTMFMLVQSGKVDVLGVTVVSGNTWVEEGTAYTLRQLEILDRTDIPVYIGAAIPLMGDRQPYLDAEERLWGNVEYRGLWRRERPPSYMELETEPYGGYPTTRPESKTATDFIVEAVKEHPNEVTLFILGPANNLALAISKNPEIIPLIKEVIYMGGAFDVPGNTTPAAEFNWWFCPESARICLRAPFKSQIIVPLDIANLVFYSKEHYDQIISGPNTPLVQMFRDLHGPRFDADPNARWRVYDALTAAIFLKPEIATHLEVRYVDMDIIYGPNYGRSMSYDERHRRDLSNPENFPAGTQKASILFDVDEDKFWEYYIDLMTRTY